MLIPRPRGATPSPLHRVYGARPHIARVGVPGAWGVVPSILSIWGNGTWGNCVSAEEAFAKAMYALMMGLPELFITEAELVSWARTHGFLNGASLTEVMDAMASYGITSNGKLYKDGPPDSVDWTNDATLSSAIFTGPVKIAVAAAQLESVVTGHNGWIAKGFRRGGVSDHCVSLCGFGSLQALCSILNIPVPAGEDPNTRCYLIFTWGTIGIIYRDSMIAITTEAWVRTPTTPGQAPISTIRLDTSPNPVASGQLVTLTATVTPAASNGVVTFQDGTASLGSGTLSNGVATLSTGVMIEGTHSLTAVYGTLVSPAVSQVVQTAPPTPVKLSVVVLNLTAKVVAVTEDFTVTISAGAKLSVDETTKAVTVPHGITVIPFPQPAATPEDHARFMMLMVNPEMRMVMVP